jgi:hypothetical protein
MLSNVNTVLERYGSNWALWPSRGESEIRHIFQNEILGN